MIYFISFSLCFILYVSAQQTVLTNPISGAIYSCSNQYSDNPCVNAFDNNVDDNWSAPINTTSPQYAVITLDSPMTVTSYQLYMLDQEDVLSDGKDYSWLPSSWTFEGSNDGTTYTTLSTVSKYISALSSSGYQSFTCSSTASYKYYRFYVTANWFIDNGYSDADTVALIELVLAFDSPTALPTTKPSSPTIAPTSAVPIVKPSIVPSVSVSKKPSIAPSVSASKKPSIAPSVSASKKPSTAPSKAKPSIAPSKAKPSIAPSKAKPSIASSMKPTALRSSRPTTNPTVKETKPKPSPI